MTSHIAGIYIHTVAGLYFLGCFSAAMLVCAGWLKIREKRSD